MADDDKKMPPGMRAEFADGSGADDDRTSDKEKERAEASEKDNARGKTDDKKDVEVEVKDDDDKKEASGMKAAEGSQLLVRGCGDAGRPDSGYMGKHAGGPDMQRHESGMERAERF